MGWTCLCSMVSPDDTYKCSTCTSRRCPECTTVNNPSVGQFCSVCDTALPWDCTACTFVNVRGDAVTCSVCGSARSDSLPKPQGAKPAPKTVVPSPGPSSPAQVTQPPVPVRQPPQPPFSPTGGSGGQVPVPPLHNNVAYPVAPQPFQQPQHQPEHQPQYNYNSSPPPLPQQPPHNYLPPMPHQQQATVPVPGSSEDHPMERAYSHTMRRKNPTPQPDPVIQGNLVAVGGRGPVVPPPLLRHQSTGNFVPMFGGGQAVRQGGGGGGGMEGQRTSSSHFGLGDVNRTKSFLNRRVHDVFTRNAVEKVEETRRLCKAADSVFVDTLNAEEARCYNWNSVLTMVRPPRPHTEWHIIDPVRGIDTTDINQGELGNCWFLSSIAVVAAHHPELIESLFITKEINSEGVFAIKLNIDGEWQSVVIDATFPTLGDNRTFKFGHCDRKSPSLWVPLLEKAYAKVNGGYKHLVSGHIEDALTDLTGCPCEKIRNSTKGSEGGTWDEVEVVTKLMSYAEADCVMAASCGGTQAIDASAKSIGLVTSHAYSILGFAYDQRTNQHKVYLRNPWGKTDCRGEPAPLTVSAELKEISGPGTFWLSFHTFTQCFHAVVVCKTMDYGTEIRASNVVASKANAFLADPNLVAQQLTLELRSPAQIVCMASQVDVRRAKNRLYYDVGFLIVRHNKSRGQSAGSAGTVLETFHITKSSIHRTCFEEVMLEAGLYSIFPFSFQCDIGFNVTIFAEAPTEQVFQVQLPEIPGLHSMTVPSPHPALTAAGGGGGLAGAIGAKGSGALAGRLFYEACTNHKKVHVSTMFSSQLVFHSTNLGSAYLYAISNTSRSWVTAQVNFKDSRGCSIIRGDHDNAVGCVSVAVPPGHAVFVCAQAILPNDGSYSVSFAYQIQCGMGPPPDFNPPAPHPCFTTFPMYS